MRPLLRPKASNCLAIDHEGATFAHGHRLYACGGHGVVGIDSVDDSVAGAVALGMIEVDLEAVCEIADVSRVAKRLARDVARLDLEQQTEGELAQLGRRQSPNVVEDPCEEGGWPATPQLPTLDDVVVEVDGVDALLGHAGGGQGVVPADLRLP